MKTLNALKMKIMVRAFPHPNQATVKTLKISRRIIPH